ASPQVGNARLGDDVRALDAAFKFGIERADLPVSTVTFNHTVTFRVYARRQLESTEGVRQRFDSCMKRHSGRGRLFVALGDVSAPNEFRVLVPEIKLALQHADLSRIFNDQSGVREV